MTNPAAGLILERTDSRFISVQDRGTGLLLRLESEDKTNRLSRACVHALLATVRQAARKPRPLVITGKEKYFSVGADLQEIAALNGPSAHEFSKMGQELMLAIESFPAPVFAAVSGYCMGGGLDLALACHRRLASPGAIVGHRGAALGLITGWGGTQRLPRLIGRARALQMFLTAEKLDAATSLRIGLIDSIADDPVAEAFRQISREEQAG